MSLMTIRPRLAPWPLLLLIATIPGEVAAHDPPSGAQLGALVQHTCHQLFGAPVSRGVC